MKRSRVLQLAAFAALAFGSPAFAGTVGGTVSPIDALTNQVFVSNLDIVGASGLTDEIIASGTIDNNNDRGWQLTVASTNSGKFFRETTTVDPGTGGTGRELLYGSVTLTKTGGTLGTGLTDPSGTSQSLTGGLTTPGVFNTRSGATLGTATTATVGYNFTLKISANANTTLLSGTYTDTITLTLANDI
jgi:hypothetical protein